MAMFFLGPTVFQYFRQPTLGPQDDVFIKIKIYEFKMNL